MGIRVSGNYDFEVRKNDTYSTFKTILTENDNGEAIDLSLPTTEVFLNIRKPNGEFLKIKAHKGIEKGSIAYEWRNGDIDIVGIYDVEPRIMFNNKRYTSLERIKFKVVDTITGE